MRKNQVSPRDNQPISTISYELTSVQVEEHPPSYDQCISSNGNLALVPEGNDLHYSQIIPFRQPSQAKVEHTSSRILSSDPLVHQSSDELWLYFMTYLRQKPRLIITILGYHYEYHHLSAMRRSNVWKQDPNYIRMKTDFNYSIDLTPYISDHYHRIAVLSQMNSIDRIDLKNLLEQYIQSTDTFKEIICSKHVAGWNLDELRYKIKQLIRSTGYNQYIRINFSYEKNEIIARSPSKLNRYLKTVWMCLLCFFTCLWIVFLPIYNCWREKSQMRHHIVAEYKMVSTAKNFLRQNARLIFNATLMRSKQRFSAVIS